MWNKPKLTKLLKDNEISLSDVSLNELLAKVEGKDTVNKIVLRFANYFIKRENNETGGKIAYQQSETFTIRACIISKLPRNMGGKYYEAENVYLFLTEPANYPETQDRNGNILPEGTLEIGSLIEAQAWTWKKHLSKPVLDDYTGKVLTFKGSYQCYKGEKMNNPLLQFSIMEIDDSNEEEFEKVVKGGFINSVSADPFFLIENKDVLYKPYLLPIVVTTVGMGQSWSVDEGKFVDLEFPAFKLYGLAHDKDNVKVSLNYTPPHEGEKDTYGLDYVPFEYSWVFNEAKDEEFPYAFAESMLEGEVVLAGFSLSSVKPFKDEYTIYGNLFGLYKFGRVKQTKIDDYELEESAIISEITTGDNMEEQQNIELILSNFKDEDKFNTVAQLTKRTGLEKKLVKALFEKMLIEVYIFQSTRGKYSIAPPDQPIESSLDGSIDEQMKEEEAVHACIKTSVDSFGTGFPPEQHLEMAKFKWSQENEIDWPIPDVLGLKLINHQLEHLAQA